MLKTSIMLSYFKNNLTICYYLLLYNIYFILWTNNMNKIEIYFTLQAVLFFEFLSVRIT